jgi:hypothetical protein
MDSGPAPSAHPGMTRRDGSQANFEIPGSPLCGAPE